MLEKFLKEKEFLIKKLLKEYGEECFNQIIDGYKQKRLTTLRVNTNRTNLEKVIDILTQNDISFIKVDFYDNALIILSNEQKISELDIFKGGYIYLQNLSSMLPAIILDPKDQTDIIDMAAAPGGKTTLISNLAPNSRITACEPNKIRMERLKHNIKLQNVKNCNLWLQDSTKIEDYYKFDNILLDAPCSGTGTISLDNEKSYKFISEALIKNSQSIQKKLLEKAINISKKGGPIVYSTCSILKEENEDVISYFVNNKKVEVIPITGINAPILPCNIQGALKVRPTKEFEGFFVCKLKKI